MSKRSKPPRKTKTAQTPGTSNDPSTSASNNLRISLTDVGAIKVSRVSKAKGKSKLQRPKPDTTQSHVDLEDSMLGTCKQGAEESIDKPSGDEDEDEEAEENGMSIPWKSANVSSVGGKSPITHAFDEIALEGLDGITLEALWTRLAVCWNVSGPISRNLMEFVWKNVRGHTEILFYQLNKPRGSLRIHGDGDLGENIYPFVPVHDTDTNVIGSCATYKERKLINIAACSLKEAEAFGNTLVLVASQRLRTNALIDHNADPRLLDEQEAFIPIQYYILEMVGRARRQGVPTAGPRSLADVSKDPKRTFYYRNQMQQMRLIIKQNFHLQKQTTYTVGGLVHLQRFYNEVKSKKQMIIEFILKILKRKPHCRVEYIELRRLVGKTTWEKYQLAKVIKSLDFRAFVKTDVLVPYRVMYPHAKTSEWKQKGRDDEKLLRVLELINHNLNINSIFKDDKDEDGRVSSDEEVDCDVPNNVMSTRRIYEAICAAGTNGITLGTLGTRSNCDHHTTRNIIKNLTAENLIDHSMQDSRRQHYILYIAREFKDNAAASITEHVTPEEGPMEVDDDVNDFIASALNVDANHMKSKYEPESEPETDESLEMPPNDYYTIQGLRRAKDKDSLKVYFGNQHAFRPADLCPLKPPLHTAEVNAQTKLFFAALLDSKDDAANSITPFVPVCQYDLAAANYTNVRKPARRNKHPAMRTLKTFKPFKRLLNSKFTTKTIDYYIHKLNAEVQEVLSSSDDEQLENVDSTESVASGIQAANASKEEVSGDVKTAMIDHFELLGSRLCDKLNSQSACLLEVTKVEVPAEETFSPANFYNVFMNAFMGPKPRVISNSTDRHNVETMLVLSSRPGDFNLTRSLISNSTRVKSRAELIRNIVNTQKIFIDLIKISTMIHQAETIDGYDARPDRKSLQRLFTTLVKDGECIIIKIIVRYRNVVRTKNLVAAPNVDMETLVQSEVDQFKNSFTMYAKRKIFDQQERSVESPTKVRRRMKCNRVIGKTYGLSPKIAKMRVLHEFLFYIIREYSGSPIPRDEARKVLQHHCGADPIDAVMQDATTLYQREINWRMFVPPLPQHKNWPDGWALISDVLLRLPVSLFVKLFNITHIIPDLPGILNHPVRKHFIVKNMPSHIKDALHGYRKYIFAIHEVFCYLSYLGLLQFGPQRMHEKDQVFVYLNTKAIFFDTTTSGNGYHHITPKEYPKLQYEFNTASDVDKYWSELYFYAINTRLGNRVSVVGQNIKLEYVHGKPGLVAARKSQTVDSVVKNDIGYLPGDGLGACRADSAIWMHSPRNWHWYTKHSKGNSSYHQYITGLRKQHLEQVKQVKLNEIQQHRREPKAKVLKRRDPGNISRIRKSRRMIVSRTFKKKVIMRKVKPRKSMKIKQRPRADQIDRKIIERMGKSRAIFDHEEDKIVLVCMACNDYLTALSRNRAVSSTAVRDFIHRVLPHSKKTSLAYRRRAFKLRNRVRLEDQKDGWNTKMIADFFTEKHFSKIRSNISRDSGQVVSDTDLNIAFIYLAQYAWSRYQLNPSKETHTVHETMKDYLKPGLIEKFGEILSKEDNFWKDPMHDDEIQQDTIQSVIHSSLSGQGNDEQWRFHLLNVYQSFSEHLVRNVVVNMRDYQFIAGRRAKSDKEGTILMSGVTYNLSFNYTFKQITLFPHCIFTEAHNLLMAIFSRLEYVQTKGLGFEKFEHGHGLGIGEFQARHKINWEFDLPDEIITLNPNMSDFSELIKELAQRYTELMKKSQEADDGSYDPEAIKNMEKTLHSYILNQRSSSTSSVDSKVTAAPSSPDPLPPVPSTLSTDSQEEDMAVEEPAIKSARIEIEKFCTADRRHRTWRISDMAFMLTKGLFPELDDDDRLEKLNEHFIVRYPTCRIRFDERLTTDDIVVKKWHEDITRDSAEILRKVLNDVLIPNALNPEANNLEPHAQRLADFIYEKNTLGASSQAIKARFPDLDVKILEHLIDTGLVIRAGVCNHAFVHHNFRHNWSIYSRKDDSDRSGYRFRISPWIRINGTLDDKILTKWLSIILSHCLSYPCITFNRLCARFNVVKPVDVYYILEILQRLACLRIWKYVRDDDEGEDIDGDFGIVPQVPGSMLDDFDDVFVETESSAITKFGAFQNRHKTDFAYAFEEAK